MLVIGNGESRKNINITLYDDDRIGCNAIHRDLFVNHLVCVDRRMVKEALDNNVTSHIYTRPDWANDYKGVLTVPELPYNGTERWDEPFQWGSGPYAVLLAAKLDTNIKLVGFDLNSKTKTVNNIYKDTSGYDAGTKRPVDPRYWIHQIGKVFSLYKKCKFTIYNDAEWTLPNAWKYPNVSLDNITNL